VVEGLTAKDLKIHDRINPTITDIKLISDQSFIGLFGSKREHPTTADKLENIIKKSAIGGSNYGVQ
jgi:hypothetical protein